MGTTLESLTTVGVLLALFILAYCRFTNRTLGELILDIREAFSTQTEEVGLELS